MSNYIVCLVRKLPLVVCSFAIFLSLLSPNHASAQLTGGEVAAGAANIAANGSTVNVTSLTDRTIINWQGFSIPSGHTANFLQPSASSAVLNRVVTQNNPSAIFGTLNSNGNVLLINPSGILVGSSGVINTNGFTASVLNLPNNEFLQGGTLNFRGDSTASVINQGIIQTGSGGAALIGGDVINDGMITSDGGSISLATGGSVTLADGSQFIHADLATIESGISPYAGLIKNGGTIRATGAIESGGEVYLVNPGGKIMHDGTIVAQNVAADGKTTGGNVQLLGDNVQLSSATIDVSGDYGGGQVNLGGNYQDKGPLPNATLTSVDTGTTINADATVQGDGGNVIVWSDDTTTFAGNISARGGSLGGNGGFAEVSGKQTLNLDGMVDLSASLGTTGTLLLDPTNYTIGVPQATLITNLLATSNLFVTTGGGGVEDGDVTINAPMLYSSTNDFSILAAGDIIANASVQNDGSGAVSLVAGWDGSTINIATILGDDATFGNAKLNGGNGSVIIGDGTQTSGIAVGSRFGATNVAAYNLTLKGSNTTSNAFAQLGFRTDSRMFNFNINGTIDVALTNNLTAIAGNQSTSYVQVGHGGYGADGNHSGNITVNAAGDLALLGGDEYTTYAQVGHGGAYTAGDLVGDIQIEANNISLVAGQHDEAYAQIGHGAAGSYSAGNRTGNITVIANGNVSMIGYDYYSPAQIGHATSGFQCEEFEFSQQLQNGIYNSIVGNIILAIDQLDPLVDGGGRLFINHHSLIDMGGLPNQVRIFGTRRLGNVIENRAIFNGIPFNGSFSMPEYSSDGWNENTEFVSWAHEQWGPTASQFTLASPGPYVDNFTFYYLGRDTPHGRFTRDLFRTMVWMLGPNTGTITYPNPVIEIAGSIVGMDKE